jgi:hypothetical protein
MSNAETDLMEGALVIAPAQISAALRAISGTLGIDPGRISAELSVLGFCTQWPATPDTPLVIPGFTGELAGPADSVVSALAPFVADGTTLDWEDNNGVRWRYVLTGGQVLEQTPVTVWRDVGDTARRTGGLLAPLVFTRDADSYAAWWAAGADIDTIADTLAGLAEPSEIEYGLHSLLLDVFQQSPEPLSWVRVSGLARGITPGYMAIDMDPSFDGEGKLSGVDVVASVQAQGCPTPQWLTVSTYVARPWYEFASDLPAEPVEALATIVDTALAIINDDISDRDDFVFTARDIIS